MNILNYRHNYIISILSFLAIATSTTYSQEYQYPASSIADSLRKDAVAVVRENSEQFIQSDINNGIYRVKHVITILDKRGDNYANFYESCDKFREIKDFSGIIRDASGKILKKIKKNDLTISSIDFDAMATSNYSSSYTYQSATYPFTAEYIYEMKWKNGILSYPAFHPILGPMLSVEKADMQIEVPSTISLRHKENYASGVSENKMAGTNVWTVSVSNLKALPYEKRTPSIREIYPLVFFAPDDFCYDSHCGNMSTWKNYGLWVADLLRDRDVLSEPFKQELVNMTSQAKSDEEKVRILYEYLQNNTRYVNISLGIGGFQPSEAASAVKNKYGDCKGLSNMMKAMLKAIGISSNYTVISTKIKELYPDFPNFNQADHVILSVPLKNDTLWLECTSQTLPFAYVHSDIAGHNALIVAEDGSGGHLRQLPSYPDIQNKEVSKLQIDILEDGTAKGSMVFTEYLSNFEEYWRMFRSNDRNKHIEYINIMTKLPKLKIGSISTSENKSKLPSCSLTAQFEAEDLTNKTGNRIFIPICPLNKSNYNIFSSEKRIFDIDFPYGYSENDTIIINIPESFSVEALPKDVSLETKYGSFVSTIKEDGKQITYIQTIDIPSGRYDKSTYKEIKDFYSKIQTAVRRKMTIKKES